MSDSELSDDAKRQQCMEEDAVKAVVEWIVESKLRPAAYPAKGRVLRSHRTLLVEGEEWHMAWKENTGGAVGGYDVCYHCVMWSDFVKKLKHDALPTIIIKRVDTNISYDGIVIKWDFSCQEK
jgi:hypothetical protein